MIKKIGLILLLGLLGGCSSKAILDKPLIKKKPDTNITTELFPSQESNVSLYITPEQKMNNKNVIYEEEEIKNETPLKNI